MKAARQAFLTVILSLLSVGLQSNPSFSQRKPKSEHASAAPSMAHASGEIVSRTGSTRNVREEPVVGVARSRYAEDSVLLRNLQLITSRPGTIVDYDDFRFIATDPLTHAEGAFAMAASASTGRPISDAWIHNWFCPEETGTSCHPRRYLEEIDVAPFLIERKELQIPKNSLDEAKALCSQSIRSHLDWLHKRIEQNRGVVLNLFSRRSFPDFPGDGNNDMHAFALYGVDEGDKSFYIRDSADRTPVSYKVTSDRLCELMVAPSNPNWGKPHYRYHRWGISAWVVTPKPEVIQRKRVPIEDVTPSNVLTPLSQDCVSPDGFCYIGNLIIPPSARSGDRRKWVFDSPSRPPRLAGLISTVGPTAVNSSRQWLEDIERRWGVERVADRSRYRVSVLKSFVSPFDNPLEEAYSFVAVNERDAIRPLAEMFLRLAKRVGRNDVWAAEAAINFVQSMRYELVGNNDNPIGLITPVQVLSKGYGDCDSRSILAAVLVRSIGLETAILSSDKIQHAVLGVVFPDSSGHRGKTQRHDGKTYTFVEMTARRRPGSVSGLVSRADDWVVTPTRWEE